MIEAEVVGALHHDVSDDGLMVAMTFHDKLGESIQLVMSADYLDGLHAAVTSAQQEARAKGAPARSQISFREMKAWAVGTHPDQNAVLVILDRDTALQGNYAMAAHTADELGAALREKALVIRQRPKP